MSFGTVNTPMKVSESVPSSTNLTVTSVEHTASLHWIVNISVPAVKLESPTYVSMIVLSVFKSASTTVTVAASPTA